MQVFTQRQQLGRDERLEVLGLHEIHPGEDGEHRLVADRGIEQVAHRLTVLGQQLETGTAGQLGVQRQILLHQAAVAQTERGAERLGVAGHQGITGARVERDTAVEVEPVAALTLETEVDAARSVGHQLLVAPLVRGLVGGEILATEQQATLLGKRWLVVDAACE